MIVLTYPHPALKMRCEPIDLTVITSHELWLLSAKMHEAMIKLKGLILTCPQIGLDARMAVITDPSRAHPLVLVNPVITFSEGSLIARENTLSLPGVMINRERAKHVKVHYFDPVSATEQDLDCGASTFLTVAVQQAVDQLNGELMIDQLSKLKRDRALKKYKKETRK